MPRTVGIGHQDFEQIITNHNFYVDKTMFIKEWWENNDAVTLITRPRRFGKTLNLNMTEYFFSVSHCRRSDLFQHLSIWQEEKYRDWQGTYPVIFLSFAGVKETSFSDARKSICQIIKNLYNKYDFLLESGHLNENEREMYHQISAHMENYLAANSLNALSDYLMRYYGKKVIILLDEYDTPMQEAYVHGYWDELVSFIRTLFNCTFKTNPFLERAIMTGITRVSKESIFSDLNNIEVVTTTSEKYETSFGFTQEEVWEALKEYDLFDEIEHVQAWYDGFTFGRSQDIYNPWSIINFLDKRKFSPYWANTSSNSLVGKLIREGSADTKMVMEDLLSGRALCTQIDEQIVFSQLGSKESAVWSLLLASGYLRVKHWSMDKRGRMIYELILTNREVLLMFEQMVEDWFSDFTPAYNSFIKALLLDDKKAMNVYMNRVAFTTFSYFDTGKHPSETTEPERFYHGFVLGLLVDLAGRYTITSNRESGFGRYDVVLEPLLDTDDAVILEFKVHDPDEEDTLADTAQEALEQIERMEYSAALQAKGIPPERIRRYGFAFEGKKVFIG
ncbi:MAG: AAA family ATPase [Lachnospiraceae bacterium]|nr:AAA family ATPase [Lachnospiraceae bacterium]